MTSLPRAWDFAGASALILWNVLAGVGLSILIVREWSTIAHPLVLIKGISQFAALMWLALQIYFLCVRYRPVGKLSGYSPRIFALAGANAAIVIALLPTNNSQSLQAVSAAIATIGLAGCIYVLLYLGRAFSVFPQARSLVVSGPYKFVRHPLYLFELISVIGVSLLYVQPLGVTIAVASFALQFPRMSYEESILRNTFSEYSEYSIKTWRVFPWVY
jgi:protein-S-isoprenylcysteine O-methyltransferase Ste14